MTKEQIYKIVAIALTALATCLAIALGLQSCNVTRTVTTQSQYYQRGDTSVVTKLAPSNPTMASKNRCRFWRYFYRHHPPERIGHIWPISKIINLTLPPLTRPRGSRRNLQSCGGESGGIGRPFD